MPQNKRLYHNALVYLESGDSSLTMGTPSRECVWSYISLDISMTSWPVPFAEDQNIQTPRKSQQVSLEFRLRLVFP